MSTQLALSIHDEYQTNRYLLAKPVSTLARMAGLRFDDVYRVLIPELSQKDLGEAIRFAEIGLKYAQIIDRNRAREEIGEAFVLALEIIINRVNDGLASKEKWIKRKAIQLHGYLVDEAAEKKRFVETVLSANLYEMIAESQNNCLELEQEIIDFEKSVGEYYEWDNAVQRIP